MARHEAVLLSGDFASGLTLHLSSFGMVGFAEHILRAKSQKGLLC